MIPPPFCPTHGVPVLGYTWVVRFEFINGVREAGLDEMQFDCGCVLIGPDMECAPSVIEGCALLTVKDMAGSPVLSFFDRFE